MKCKTAKAPDNRHANLWHRVHLIGDTTLNCKGNENQCCSDAHLLQDTGCHWLVWPAWQLAEQENECINAGEPLCIKASVMNTSRRRSHKCYPH